MWCEMVDFFEGVGAGVAKARRIDKLNAAEKRAKAERRERQRSDYQIRKAHCISWAYKMANEHGADYHGCISRCKTNKWKIPTN